jgi:hypothetical protein
MGSKVLASLLIGHHQAEHYVGPNDQMMCIVSK